jgi:UDP-glucose 4-epimerase
MKVLVTGGASYIGSVVTEILVGQAHEVDVLDSLKTGFRDAVEPSARFHKLDLLDREGMMKLFAERSFDAVLHLAAEAAIEHSISDPGLYFRTNVSGGINLLDAMIEHDVKRIVFSSTAAVFGQPDEMPITELTSKAPVNTYGESKLQFERIMSWYRIAHGLRYVSFRYFNACGATQAHGEFRRRESHIIPILFEVARGIRPKFTVFGSDYPTPDGSCVRDYVHVYDIAMAHVQALERIDELKERDFNLGNGEGLSNLEVIKAVRQVTGIDFEVAVGDRRPGDPATLIASSDRARKELNWEPRYPDLISMVQTAWDWRQAHPDGYAQ